MKVAISSNALAWQCGFEIAFDYVLTITRQNSTKETTKSYENVLEALGESFRISAVHSIRSRI